MIETHVGQKINLPAPEKEGGMPLYEALSKRQSKRDFDPDKKVDIKIISQALWACYGSNRAKKKLKTTPSAKGWYPLLVYVFLEQGVYLYDAIEHSLTKKFNGDLRYLTGTQTDLVNSARVNIVLIADNGIIVRARRDLFHHLPDGSEIAKVLMEREYT